MSFPLAETRPPPAPGNCPSEQSLLSFLLGNLADTQRHAVEAHLDRCDECALVVVEAGQLATESPIADERPAKSGRKTVFSPGQVIAQRYEVLRLLGRGGMGEVFLAMDTALGETVALKTLCQDVLAKPGIVERFKNEVRLSRRVTHPGVCRILEFGYHREPGGAAQHFFTMQYLEGKPLRVALWASRFSEADALEIAEQLAAGLRAIHAEGIVHRDIKPDNIMLTQRVDGQVRVSWLDFGVARTGQKWSVPATSLAGTPDYFAPELLKGRPASTASDIYALGLVLFQLFTGWQPWSEVGEAPSAIKRLRGDFRLLLGELAPPLRALVSDCLSPDPRLRPESAAAVGLRLREYRLHRASCTRAERWRLRWRHAPALLLTGVILGSIVSVTVQAPGPSGAKLASAPSAEVTPQSMVPRPSPETTAWAAPTAPLAHPSVQPSARTAHARLVPAGPPAASASLSVAAAEASVPDFGGRR